jgi:putative transposase
LAHRDGEEFQKFQNGFSNGVKLDVEVRLREGVKAVLEKVLQEEMNDHVGAHRESTSRGRRERNGYYGRDLVTPAGKVEDLRVPRDREGEFVTEVFERYKRITGNVEQAILEILVA